MSSPSSVESSIEECTTSNSAKKSVIEHSFLRLSDAAEEMENECDWNGFRDDDILHQQSNIQLEVAEKMPCVGDKEPLLALATEYESGSPILQEKIKMLCERYSAMRRTRGDGNCFFRSFMFSYLEHILETQDKAEVLRMKSSIEQSKRTLLDLGYAEFTFEDYFETFKDLLEHSEQGLMSADILLEKSRDRGHSDSAVMFLRFVTTGEIRRRAEFFEPFILGVSDSVGTVDQFCKSSVEPMGEESDHVHITALTDALGVAVRVVYLDRSSCDGDTLKVNHHDFVPSYVADPSPTPFLTLLYRPGHYDILYSFPAMG